MKTLIDATREEKGKWSLMYVKDYPVREEDEFIFYPLTMIDYEKGLIGYDDGVGITELKTEKKSIMLTDAEEERFTREMKWKKVIFENGEAMFLPPDVEKLNETN